MFDLPRKSEIMITAEDVEQEPVQTEEEEQTLGPQEVQEGEDEDVILKEGDTVLILPNISAKAVLPESLREPFHQLSTLAAVAIDRAVNPMFPRYVLDDLWNNGHADMAADEIVELVNGVDHVWCVGFWTGGVRLLICKVAQRLGKPITFLNWDAANGGFQVEDSGSFNEDENAVEKQESDTHFAYKYLPDNPPAMEEVILSLPIPRVEEQQIE